MSATISTIALQPVTHIEVVCRESLALPTLIRSGVGGRSGSVAISVLSQGSIRMHVSERGFAGHDQYTTVVRSKRSQMVLNHPKTTRP